MTDTAVRPDVTVSITITDQDCEVLELLRERHGRDDQTGILEHILNEYYGRLALAWECAE